MKPGQNGQPSFITTRGLGIGPGLGLSLPTVQVSQVAITKYHGLDGLQNRKLLSHSSGGYRSKGKVLVLSEGCEARICFRFLSLAYRWSSSICVFSHYLSSMSLWVQVFSFYKETSHIGLRPTLMISF